MSNWIHLWTLLDGIDYHSICFDFKNRMEERNCSISSLPNWREKNEVFNGMKHGLSIQFTYYQFLFLFLHSLLLFGLKAKLLEYRRCGWARVETSSGPQSRHYSWADIWWTHNPKQSSNNKPGPISCLLLLLPRLHFRASLVSSPRRSRTSS